MPDWSRSAYKVLRLMSGGNGQRWGSVRAALPPTPARASRIAGIHMRCRGWGSRAGEK